LVVAAPALLLLAALEPVPVAVAFLVASAPVVASPEEGFVAFAGELPVAVAAETVMRPAAISRETSEAYLGATETMYAWASVGRDENHAGGAEATDARYAGPAVGLDKARRAEVGIPVAKL
jgi:hypothetical protein